RMARRRRSDDRTWRDLLDHVDTEGSRQACDPYDGVVVRRPSTRLLGDANARRQITPSSTRSSPGRVAQGHFRSNYQLSSASSCFFSCISAFFSWALALARASSSLNSSRPLSACARPSVRSASSSASAPAASLTLPLACSITPIAGSLQLLAV